IANIDTDGLGPGALIGQAARGRFRLGRLDISDDDDSTFLGEAFGYAETDALRGPGDNSNAAGQTMVTIFAHTIPPRTRLSVSSARRRSMQRRLKPTG